MATIQDSCVVDPPPMSNEAPLEVESSADDNGQNEDPEVTFLSRDPGGQARKARSRQQGGSTAPVWTFFDKKKVNSVQLAFCLGGEM